MWGIWDQVEQDWVRELPSKVDDGGIAVLAFERKRDAQRRAAQHYGFRGYSEVKFAGWCEVRDLGVTCPTSARRREVVRK